MGGAWELEVLLGHDRFDESPDEEEAAMPRKNLKILKVFLFALAGMAVFASLIQVPAVSAGSREGGTTARALLKVTGMT